MLNSIWILLAKWGAVIGMALWVLFKARQSGEEKVERKQAMETLKNVQLRDKVEGDINARTPDELAELYKKWQR